MHKSFADWYRARGGRAEHGSADEAVDRGRGLHGGGHDRRGPRHRPPWDHNERLRRAVAVRFARGDWPMTYLPQVVRGELALDLLLGHCLETEAGRRFVVKVVKGVPRPIRWVQRFVAKAAARQRA